MFFPVTFFYAGKDKVSIKAVRQQRTLSKAPIATRNRTQLTYAWPKTA